MIRMQPGIAVVVGTIAFVSLYACDRSQAKGFKPIPLPYSCAQVRMAIEHFTIPHLETIAKDLHITITTYQRRQVAACMKGA